MPPKAVCPQCNGSSFEQDNAAGDLVCSNCGRVLEESQIVSEITFGEAASGAAVVQGSYVGADQGITRITIIEAVLILFRGQY